MGAVALAGPRNVFALSRAAWGGASMLATEARRMAISSISSRLFTREAAFTEVRLTMPTARYAVNESGQEMIQYTKSKILGLVKRYTSLTSSRSGIERNKTISLAE